MMKRASKYGRSASSWALLLALSGCGGSKPGTGGPDASASLDAGPTSDLSTTMAADVGDMSGTGSPDAPALLDAGPTSDLSTTMADDAGDMSGAAMASAMIDASGGIVATLDGSVRLTIPAGALTSATMITIAPGSPSVSGAIGPIWELGPTGTQFQQPVTLALAYSDSELGGHPVASATVSTVFDEEWVPLNNQTQDTTAHLISGQTLHLSPYALTLGRTIKSNDPSCPSSDFGIGPGDACTVAAKTCRYVVPSANGQNGGVNDYYCGQAWSGSFIQDNSFCPLAPSNGLACNPAFATHCNYAGTMDCATLCSCNQDTSGTLYHFRCNDSCGCVAANSAYKCNGQVPADSSAAQGTRCPYGADGVTCVEYCDYGGNVGCESVTATCHGGQWQVSQATATSSTQCLY
jgi:hypothetical protein